MGREAAEHVIVAHGLRMPAHLSTALLRYRLRAAGFEPHVFSYPSVAGGLDENVERLAAYARSLTSTGRVHFVGHSLGGVITVRMFQRYHWDHPGRVVCLGSPLAGCHSGKTLLGWRGGEAFVGRSISNLIDNITLEPWNGPCELGIVAGDKTHGFSLLTGLPNPNDGIVAVAETRLPGVNDHCVMHTTHPGLMWSRKVADEVVHFLSTGHFIPAPTAHSG